ncbi:hypothetical protein HCZ30_08275 [Marivivens donghaensis]|uniref:Uncharacterized protein n=1 Tax=Marivivens donghaensis TaxID=1699413 RepID=A0ABX0W0N4_9RHOB|nr:hypothetical protein [Marivivens donghaensis]NIY72433.1 hypothetical protein [Marivivens donghaensis]
MAKLRTGVQPKMVITDFHMPGKNGAHETNECSMSFMRYLHDIEDKIIEEREKTDAAVAHLGNLDTMAQTYREDQRALEADLADAIAVG